MIILGYDIYLRYIPLPYHIGGGTVPTDDAGYDVYLNSRLGEEAQEAAFRHELGHIISGHFDVDCTLTTAEKDAVAEIVARCLHPLVA